jgi:hypothetical protein
MPSRGDYKQHNSTTFWDVTPCSLVEIFLRFGGTYCLHRQGRKVSQTSNKLACYLLHACFAFDDEDKGSALLGEVGVFLPDYKA